MIEITVEREQHDVKAKGVGIFKAIGASMWFVMVGQRCWSIKLSNGRSA